MWKILAAHIKEEVYYFQGYCGLFPEELKRFHMETRGKGDLQYINQQILKESNIRRENVAFAWMDLKMQMI